jgi:hypothetical protein
MKFHSRYHLISMEEDAKKVIPGGNDEMHRLGPWEDKNDSLREQ